MSERGFQFRTAAFGGFRKEDVLAYLEQSSKAHAEKISALQRELNELKAKSDAGEDQGAALSAEVERLKAENERLSAELAAAVTGRDELETLARQMQGKLERVGPSAQAYEMIKDRTAGIELEAHGRAQAIEEEARRKAGEVREQVALWFEKVSAAYDRMRGDLDATMNHALREMQRAYQNLEDISGDLTTHDEALGAIRKAMEEGAQPAQPSASEETPSEP